jgi:hypothetical protein
VEVVQFDELHELDAVEEFYDPMDEENYMVYAGDDEDEETAKEKTYCPRPNKFCGDDEVTSSGEDEDETAEKEVQTAAENVRKDTPKIINKTSNKKQKLPSTKTQRKQLGYMISDSSNTDLYSTDEDRPEHHKKQNGDESHKDILNSSFNPSVHCDKCVGTNKIPHIEFEISADGVQIHKKAVKCAAWPLMGQILFISPCIHLKNKVRFYMPRNTKPVIIGFYYGTTKPSCANSYLKCVFKEMRLAEKRGLCTMFLRFYIGDGPSRQFIKGFPSSTAYCGCER